ncbi:hypothetical protein SAMN05216577_1166 [Pseudomonas citronellolis]|uniref:Uncharacterized protein n=1 Tax=Pseudomonas citronellolis TaxID=53408 RepID=A0AAQ1HPH0_9PSED|nr:hypothetical protein [Pseudomonas citronellolis]TGC32391.1 hypothetical protein CW310_01845 [Pseudomonas citronellolis]SFD07226.1 hypothetical protein SAMN05216577_1166 [Pseudomonas citronellolis]
MKLNDAHLWNLLRFRRSNNASMSNSDAVDDLVRLGLLDRHQATLPLGTAIGNAIVAKANEILLAVQNGTTRIDEHGWFTGGSVTVHCDSVSLSGTTEMQEAAQRAIRDAVNRGVLHGPLRAGETVFPDVKAGEVWYARFSGGLSGSNALHLIRLTEVTDTRVSYQSWDDWRAYQDLQRAMQPNRPYPYEAPPPVAHYLRRAVTFVERLELPNGD